MIHDILIKKKDGFYYVEDEPFTNYREAHNFAECEVEKLRDLTGIDINIIREYNC